MKIKLLIWALALYFFSCFTALGQKYPAFKGQASAYFNYGFKSDIPGLVGARYIPELSQKFEMDSTRFIDYEVSANIYTTYAFAIPDTGVYVGNIQPYRGWLRYSTDQFELRVGLQKINFGSATVLRPLMWFDEIDPRDPLQLTNGVYGALARYYFLNNANVWVWGLYGNDNPRGWDIVPSSQTQPEFGGRVQYPIPRGEMAFTYHHRVANPSSIPTLETYTQVVENRYGFDIKADVEVGLWLEGSWIQRTQNMGALTNHTMINLGTDYTFGIGNGLNVNLEYLINAYDEEAFAFESMSQSVGAAIGYPLGFFDNINAYAFYDWSQNVGSVTVNYEHQFDVITAYFMAYYNPEITDAGSGINQGNNTNLNNQLMGPGIRLMLLYNH